MLCLRSSLDYSQVRPDFCFPAAAASLSPFPFAILPVTRGQLKARVSAGLFYAPVPVHPSDSPSPVCHPKLNDEGSPGPPYPWGMSRIRLGVWFPSALPRTYIQSSCCGRNSFWVGNGDLSDLSGGGLPEYSF